MRRSWYSLAALAIVAFSLLLTAASCKKKVAGPKPPSVNQEAAQPEAKTPSPAPTISLAVNPTAIGKGQSTTLSWTSGNAANVTIDNGVGTVEPSGSRTIKPNDSTTYVARATGPGGNAVAEARVTVTAPEAVIETAPPKIPIDKIIKDAFYDYDQYNIRPDAQTALIEDARALKEYPKVRITIEGYCDERGSEKYNLALGDMRANAAKEFLVKQGVDSSRIDTISYGKEQSFCEEHNEGCWQQNRRAHLVIR
jgi:peptidoglycan-associated lipoprotein